MKALWGLAIGVACAVAIACGGATMQKAAAPSPRAAESAAGMPESPKQEKQEKQEIERLDKEIAQKLDEMHVTPPAAVPMSAVDPRTQQQEAMTAAADLKTCAHGTSETCKSSCDLSTAICDNSVKICKLAEALGNDQWANGKCASGKNSCDAAHGRCCSCQP